jgi:RimJ/RimL family protein N-acetyltransferase
VAALPDLIPGVAVALRRYHPDDAAGLTDAYNASFEGLRTWMTWATDIASESEMRERLEDGEHSFDADREWTYLIVETATSDIVGSIGLHPRVGPSAMEIGYWVRTDRTGRGYATEAASALAHAAYWFLPDLERIEIHMDVSNVASAAVARKIGFSLAREEKRPAVAPGHTGRYYVFTLERPRLQE